MSDYSFKIEEIQNPTIDQAVPNPYGTKSFETVKYHDGSDDDAKWKVEGETDIDRTQDVNRPGISQITKAFDDGTEKNHFGCHHIILI